MILDKVRIPKCKTEIMIMTHIPMCKEYNTIRQGEKKQVITSHQLDTD